MEKQNPLWNDKTYRDMMDEEDVRKFRNEIRKSSKQSHQIAIWTLIIALATLVVSLISLFK